MIRREVKFLKPDEQIKVEIINHLMVKIVLGDVEIHITKDKLKELQNKIKGVIL